MAISESVAGSPVDRYLSGAHAFLEEGNVLEAGKAIAAALKRDPDNAEGLFLYGQALLSSDKPMFARLAYERLVNGAGRKRYQAWVNLGKCYDDLGWNDRARGCYRKALKLHPDLPTATRNMGTSYVQSHAWEKATEWAKRSLSLADDVQSHIDLAYCHLNTGNLAEGWDEYAFGMGEMQWRDVKNYGGEPLWDGEPGNVVVYGEQGIGDQIAYMSCAQGMKADIAVIDCHSKLEGLFKRTFGVPTYGTMFDDPVPWKAEFTASAPMSRLPKFTRRKAEDFPQGGYLKPCPVRTEQWREYLGKLPGKKIGLAWTGGIEQTGQEERSTGFETFAPLIRDGHTFISLEYRSPGDIPIPHYPWATETRDYDDTAALVANLDLVICVPTSVSHLAGGLNVPCWVIQHSRPHFLFKMPLWGSVKNYWRNGASWAVIEQVAADLDEWLTEREAA